MSRLLSCGCFAFVLAVMAACSLRSSSQEAALAPLEKLLSQVSPDATWETLAGLQRQQFEQHARLVLERDRRNWGQEGLAAKERVLLTERTQAMRENIDRVLSVKFSAELPGGFALQRDIADADLAKALAGVYLIEMTKRAYLLFNQPDYRGWDGQKIIGVDDRKRELLGEALSPMPRLAACTKLSASTPSENSARKSLFLSTPGSACAARQRVAEEHHREALDLRFLQGLFGGRGRVGEVERPRADRAPEKRSS